MSARPDERPLAGVPPTPPPTPPSAPTPPAEATAQWRALRRSVSDARLLGIVFILVGALLTLPLLAGGIGTLTGQLLAGASSVLLIGPGVLYWIAANALGAHRPSGAILARRAAAAHLASILLTLMLALAAGGINGFAGVMFIPAIVGMFFVPALIAFLAQTRTALAAAHTFGQTGRAFEPLPMAKIAQPIEPDPPNPD